MAKGKKENETSATGTLLDILVTLALVGVGFWAGQAFPPEEGCSTCECPGNLYMNVNGNVTAIIENGWINVNCFVDGIGCHEKLERCEQAKVRTNITIPNEWENRTNITANWTIWDVNWTGWNYTADINENDTYPLQGETK